MASWPYYTARWQRLRMVKLNAEPLCQTCVVRGELVSAEVVDHNQPISQGGDPFPSLEGLTSLCARCHNEKTAGFDKQGGNATGRRFKGCDAQGNPIDVADGWFGTGGPSNHENRSCQGPAGKAHAYLIKDLKKWD